MHYLLSLLSPVWASFSVAVLGGANGERWWAIVLGGLLAVVAVSLLIASWTKWGQTKSLTKCIALAFLAHIWLLVYAYGTRIVTPGSGGGHHGGASSTGVVSVLLSNSGEYSNFPPASLTDPTTSSAPATDATSSAAETKSSDIAKEENASGEEESTTSAEGVEQSSAPESRSTRMSLNEWEKPISSVQEQALIPITELPTPELEQLADTLSNLGEFEATSLAELEPISPDFGEPDFNHFDAPSPEIQPPTSEPSVPVQAPASNQELASAPILPPYQGAAQPGSEPLDLGFVPVPPASQLGNMPLSPAPMTSPMAAPLPNPYSFPSPTNNFSSQSALTPTHALSAGNRSNRSSVTPQVASAISTSTYQNRFSNNRMDIVRAGGGDESTEAAVEMALQWLARTQSPNGGWNAAAYGAGNPAMINRAGPDGERRQNAGVKANTAMTGLALLAFLGAGHHHLDGPYASTVQSALQYLINEQLPSGDMSGREQIGREDAVRFARMYSHGMAAFAVAEAYAITGDANLLPAVRSACRYSIVAMNQRTGGWRYEYPTEDPGDTSQFGWQAMLLHSAANAGASPLSHDVQSRMERFLNSVATGRANGLATYRPPRGRGNAEQATPSMTAEALASRLLLNIPTNQEAAIEAQQFLLQSLPGREQDNFYYWYYATLALYQLKGISQNSFTAKTHSDGWNQWNDALKKRLCSTQVTSGPNQGSWNPTCVWGNYGGRVYTTALGALSLEVYYRYLPILQTNMAQSPGPNSHWSSAAAPIR